MGMGGPQGLSWRATRYANYDIRGGGVFKYFLPEMQHFIKPLKCEKNSELKEKLK